MVKYYTYETKQLKQSHLFLQILLTYKRKFLISENVFRISPILAIGGFEMIFVHSRVNVAFRAKKFQCSARIN